MPLGKIKKLVADKGFGFIQTDSGTDIFFHHSTVADQGFVVDPTFREFTRENQSRFAQFTSTRDLFLPGGALPDVGSVFRNPDLANTCRLLAHAGTVALYGG